MLSAIIANYLIFIVIGVVLILGLIGYIMDKKKYEEYKQEILNQDKAMQTLDANPNIQSVTTPVSTEKE